MSGCYGRMIFKSPTCTKPRTLPAIGQKQLTNKSFMKKTLIIIFSWTILSSCKKETLPIIDCSKKSNKMDDVKALIKGTYTWVYTRVNNQGTSPLIETPSSTGLNYKYVFDGSGNVDYYENNQLKSSDNYVIDYEFKVTTYPTDSATILIINDKQSGIRKSFFRPWLCNDSSHFYNPYSSIDYQRYFKRN
jgi:hypothetical protein